MHQCQPKTLLGSFTPAWTRGQCGQGASAMGQSETFLQLYKQIPKNVMTSNVSVKPNIDNGMHFFQLETLWIDIFPTIRRSMALSLTAPWFMEILQSVWNV